MQEKLSRKKAVPASLNLKFLLDENVSNNLRKVLISKGCDVITVQELDKRGVKNSELMELARIKNRILITYDKDFIHFKHVKDNFLIIIDIHPLIDEYVRPIFEKCIEALNFDDLKDYFIVLDKTNINLRKKV